MMGKIATLVTLLVITTAAHADGKSIGYLVYANCRPLTGSSSAKIANEAGESVEYAISTFKCLQLQDALDDMSDLVKACHRVMVNFEQDPDTKRIIGTIESKIVLSKCY